MVGKKQCEICKHKFSSRDLYPMALIRESTFESAQKKYPDIHREGYICFPDLRNIHASYYEDILKEERGVLSDLEEEVLSSIKQHDILSENINEEFDSKRTIGERLADRIASFGGSWTFISIFGCILIAWVAVNSVQLILDRAFDPYPYILLNLVLSSLAAFQAPIIMMSQNRQAAKDRLSQESDFQINLKSELQIRQLNTRMEMFMRHSWQKMHELSRMQEEILQELESSRHN